MALTLIIDGYNLLHCFFRGQHLRFPSLEEARERLLRELAAYQSQKTHRVIVVFDGWKNGVSIEQHQQQGQIKIIYSRLGEKADEVIKRLLVQTASPVVISSDWEIRNFAADRGVTSVPAMEFVNRLRKAKESGEGDFYGSEDDMDEPINFRGTKKRGPSYRLSRKESKRKSLLRKL